jgi:hypothetical protein
MESEIKSWGTEIKTNGESVIFTLADGQISRDKFQ